MASEVLLTDDAERDLDEIYDYIFIHDSPERADYVIGEIASVLESLSTMPQRGNHPNELLELGIREYREVFFKPYRVIYRVIGSKVFVFLIADGRRDMQSLLEGRLLAG